VRRVLVDVGTEVRAGEVLVELHSVASAEAKTAFVSATVDADLKKLTYEREEGLVAKKISPRQDLQEAEAAYKTAASTLSMARQRLINFGFLPDEISRIEKSQDCSAALLVRAPYGGTLVERTAVVGEAVEPGDALFTLANLSTMWLSLSIPGDNAKFLRSGLEVEASLSGLPDESVRGQLTWVNTSIDERSRMVQARAVVRNEKRLLKSGMFGEALVLLSPKIPVLGIPAGAVQKLENRPFVFVKLADDLYGLRRVVVGHVANGFVAVAEGLRPDDQVIVEGAFTALSEFLKSRLGAGCVDD
jgi:cobalt-zinc-cadmium efflux system membrane fusion protein